MRITIETGDVKMVLTDDLIDNVTLKTPMNVEPTACDCPIPCKSVHQKLTGKGSFELKGDLTGRPVWVEA
jgi:hypothetical protein